MAKIINKQRTAQTLNIPCRVGCDGTDCLCSEINTELVVELESGERGTKVLSRRLPGAITILGGDSLVVPDWVAESAPVKDGVAKGSLRLVKE